jgi:hypothetical protein
MSKVIVFNQNNGIPAVIFPTPECLKTRSIMEIAIKDVPTGKKFKIVDYSSLPLNVPQEAWVINEADLTDGVGGKSNEFN